MTDSTAQTGTVDGQAYACHEQNRHASVTCFVTTPVATDDAMLLDRIATAVMRRAHGKVAVDLSSDRLRDVGSGWDVFFEFRLSDGTIVRRRYRARVVARSLGASQAGSLHWLADSRRARRAPQRATSPMPPAPAIAAIALFGATPATRNSTVSTKAAAGMHTTAPSCTRTGPQARVLQTMSASSEKNTPNSTWNAIASTAAVRAPRGNAPRA
ncbi:MAG: hypothetical protein INH34_17705 [Phycisphaerales bacterium]|nr:hypothetical protein [Phycisphaerales bacterium]